MADCTPDITALNATRGPVGYGDELGQHTQVAQDIIRDRLNQAREALDRNRIIEDTSTAGATDTGYTPEASKGEKAVANAMGKRAAKFWDWGTKGQQALADAWEQAVRMVNGTSVADATWWTNMQNRVGKWFADDRHDMVHWLDTVGNMSGRLAVENPLVQSFTGMVPKIRGINNMFLSRHQAIIQDLRPIAGRTGHSVETLFDMVGNYLNCLHAPEGNAHLIKRWQAEADAAEARIKQLNPDKDTDALAAAQRDLNGALKRIKDLTDNLENPDPPEGVISRGYTNAEAKRTMQEIERATGMTSEELRATARRISDEYNYITEELAKAGVVEPELLRQLPDFEWYAPQLGHGENLKAVSNDTSFYLANSYHAMDGMKGRPDSAALSLGLFARRAATEIGMQDFGAVLRGLYIKSQKDKKDIGLRMTTLAMGDNSNGLKGMVIRVPIKNADGTVTMQKRHFYFEDSWRMGNVTGAQLNDALGSNYKMGNAFVEAMRSATSYYGQAFTRFQPGFAIVGGLRDFMERAANMVNRTYYTSAGRKIDGLGLVKSFLGNGRRANRMLREALWNKIPEGSQNAKFWDEFNREGLFQKYLPDKNQQPRSIAELASQTSKLSGFLRREGLGKWADDLDKRNFKDVNRALELAKDKGQQALFQLDRLNDWLQNSAAYSQYITLREAGMDPRAAAAGVREMMDLTKAGTVTQYLSVISPFMRPTMQGAQALARTFGLNARNPKDIFTQGKRGWMLAAGAGVAFSTLYPVLRDMLGQDESGNYRMDNMSITKATSSIPIGIGDMGEYVRLPMPFGPVRIAAVLGLCMDRVWRGKMEPSEMAFQVMYAAGRDVAPSNAPGFDFKESPAAYITNMLAPAGIKPFIELGTNINNFGGKIYNDYDQNRAKSDQGRRSTPALWHNMARWIHKNGGPDLAPEQYMHFMKGMVHGPLRLLTTTIVDGVSKESVHQGMETPTAYEEMPGWLKAMGLTLFYGREAKSEQYGYYNARKIITDEVKRLGVNMSKTTELREKLTEAGMEPDMIEKTMLLAEADKQLRQLGGAFTKEWGRWYEKEDQADELEAAFSKLTDDQLAVYVGFLKRMQEL